MAKAGHMTDPNVMIRYYRRGEHLHEVSGLLIPRVGDTIRLMYSRNPVDRQGAQSYKVLQVVWEYTTEVEYQDGSHQHPHIIVHVE